MSAAALSTSVTRINYFSDTWTLLLCQRASPHVTTTHWQMTSPLPPQPQCSQDVGTETTSVPRSPITLTSMDGSNKRRHARKQRTEFKFKQSDLTTRSSTDHELNPRVSPSWGGPGLRTRAALGMEENVPPKTASKPSSFGDTFPRNPHWGVYATTPLNKLYIYARTTAFRMLIHAAPILSLGRKAHTVPTTAMIEQITIRNQSNTLSFILISLPKSFR